jgi:hypothetical protein
VEWRSYQGCGNSVDASRALLSKEEAETSGGMLPRTRKGKEGRQ